MNDLRKAQILMLEMLVIIDELCKKNNIEYWLDAGTLLGAVRHGGFIPWDDDVDIAMDLENYTKFKKIAENYKEKRYVFDIPKKINKNKLKYIKFLSKEHEIEELTRKGGLFIDIFPYERYSKKRSTLDKIISKIYMIKANFNLRLFKWNLSNILVNLVKFIRGIVYSLIPIKLLDCYAKKQKNIKGKYIGYSLNTGFSERVKLEDIYPLSTIEFEGYKFYCPGNYKNYLTKFYGEYMQIPPENKRVSHALKIEINKEFLDKNKFYLNFIKRY